MYAFRNTEFQKWYDKNIAADSDRMFNFNMILRYVLRKSSSNWNGIDVKTMYKTWVFDCSLYECLIRMACNSDPVSAKLTEFIKSAREGTHPETPELFEAFQNWQTLKRVVEALALEAQVLWEKRLIPINGSCYPENAQKAHLVRILGRRYAQRLVQEVQDATAIFSGELRNALENQAKQHADHIQAQLDFWLDQQSRWSGHMLIDKMLEIELNTYDIDCTEPPSRTPLAMFDLNLLTGLFFPEQAEGEDPVVLAFIRKQQTLA